MDFNLDLDLDHPIRPILLHTARLREPRSCIPDSGPGPRRGPGPGQSMVGSCDRNQIPRRPIRWLNTLVEAAGRAGALVAGVSRCTYPTGRTADGEKQEWPISH